MIVKYLILSDGVPQHITDLNSLRNSWARSLSLRDIFYLRGGKSQNRLDEFGNLEVAAPYESVLEKTKMGVSIILSKFDFDYLVRVNASTYVRPDLVNKYLTQQIPKFAGFPIRNTPNKLSNQGLTFFMSGAFLILNRECCELLANLNCDDFVGIPDDVAITSFFFLHNIEIDRVPRNSFSDFHILRKKTHSRLKTSSLDKAASSRFQIIFKLESSARRLEKLKLWTILYKNELRLLNQDSESSLDWLRKMYVAFAGQASYWSYRSRALLGSRRKPL